METPRYIMIGGFLGAGKTTTIQKFGQWLSDQGLKVGLVTNDQGSGLVDSALGRSNKFPVEEISGGCFCCRFDSLVDAAEKLTEVTRPDVFLAEPVGSCTDLVATVSLPLKAIYGDAYRIAPLSVLVDPVRALRILGVEDGKRFSENVRYIYRKQLEEADAIVINKIDLLDPARLAALRAALAEQFPQARVFEQSAREDQNLTPWFDFAFSSEMKTPQYLKIDYEQYANGESLLGWLNATIEVESEDEFDGNTLLLEIATALQKQLQSEQADIAHLKMTLAPNDDPYEIAAVNLTRDDMQPETSHRLFEPMDEGEILLNMRVEATPEVLKRAMDNGLAEVFSKSKSVSHRITHFEHFKPGKPTPTHRLTSLAK